MKYPLTEKTITREGCTLHYWVSEKEAKPWLMLLHGAGADHTMFDDQIATLAPDYSLIALDMRGHGLSRPIGAKPTAARMVQDALAVLDSAGAAKATFIGQSTGGNIAQEIAYSHPERVESLVFIDCTCNTMELTQMEKFALWCSPFVFAIYPWKTLVDQSASASSVRADVRERLKSYFNTVGKRDFSAIMDAATGCLNYDEGYRINKPILLVCGESDGTGNIRKCAPLWAAREAQCEFHWITNAGHCANMDNPEEFNGILVHFLQQHTLKG